MIVRTARRGSSEDGRVREPPHLGPRPPGRCSTCTRYLLDEANKPPLLEPTSVVCLDSLTMFPTAGRVLGSAAGPLLSRGASALSRCSRSRLLSTLAILEQRDGQLNLASLSAFTAAKKLGGTVHGFVAGSKVSAAAEQAAKVDGVEQVIAVENEAYEKVSPLPVDDAPPRAYNPPIDPPAPSAQDADLRPRVSPKTTLRCWSRTSKRATTRMSSRATRPLARTFCPELRRC